MKIKLILEYIDELFPNAECELKYNKDYELLIATMLSAQTTDKKVNQVTEILFKKYPDLQTLNNASLEDIKNIIRPIGTYNKKTNNLIEITRELLKYGYVPNDRKFIESLPGVGRKTANVVLSNLYDIPCIAVDTHVSRTSIRLGLAHKNDNTKKIEEKLTKKFPKNKLCRIHHQLVLFGRYHCKAQKPNCKECKLKYICKKDIISNL